MVLRQVRDKYVNQGKTITDGTSRIGLTVSRHSTAAQFLRIAQWMRTVSPASNMNSLRRSIQRQRNHTRDRKVIQLRRSII